MSAARQESTSFSFRSIEIYDEMHNFACMLHVSVYMRRIHFDREQLER